MFTASGPGPSLRSTTAPNAGVMFTGKPMRRFKILISILIFQGCANPEEWVESDYTYKIQEKDYEACRDYAKAAVRYLNQNNQFISGPINFEGVTYLEEGVCIDTFIPGREATDCFDFVQFKVPLGELPR